MRVDVCADADEMAAFACAMLVALASECIATRGRFVCALSGGSTPWRTLQRFAGASVDWSRVHILQVDERVAPDGDDLRNATHLHDAFLSRVPEPLGGVHLMPVGTMSAIDAAQSYSRLLHDISGTPSRIDLVHLGLGDDGHTASLVPRDLALRVGDIDVAATGRYAGTQRVTLTYPVLFRARHILWLVSGASKQHAFAQLVAGDATIPAARVRRECAHVLVDQAAAGGISSIYDSASYRKIAT